MDIRHFKDCGFLEKNSQRNSAYGRKTYMHSGSKDCDYAYRRSSKSVFTMFFFGGIREVDAEKKQSIVYS